MNKTTSIRRRAFNGGLVFALAIGALASGTAASASTESAADVPAASVGQSADNRSSAQGLNLACLYFQYTFNSSPTDPQPGDAVTYRMEFVNNGNVDSTKSEIVFGLGGVLDDSSWDAASIGSTLGATTVTGDTVTWKGPLGSGERVVIAFTGIWHGSGDGLAFPRVDYYGYAR